jgi:hypothetical protein
MTKIKLYHYSQEDFKGHIEPRFFGLNNYSRNSERLSGVKRAYFYLNRAGREYYFNGAKYCYIAEVKPSRLYDINKDPLKLAGRGKDIFAEVKKRGYIGLIGNNGFRAGAVFYPIKINKRLLLTRV